MSVKAFSSGFSNGFGGAYSRGYLQLMVGNHPTYEDGDIVSAINWRRVRHMKAEQFCFQRSAGRRFANVNAQNFLPIGDVMQDWCEIVYQYRFTRTGKNTMTITRLSDLAEIEVTSNTPYTGFDGRPEQMDVDLFCRRRQVSLTANNAQGRPLFGDNINSIIWYGGRQEVSHANLDNVWTAIEAKTAHTESEVRYAPFNSYRKRLVIAVDDFDDDAAGDLTAPLVDNTDPENPVQVKKRKNWIVWRGLRDVVEADVLDPAKVIRIDQIRKHVCSEIVQLKGL